MKTIDRFAVKLNGRLWPVHFVKTSKHLGPKDFGVCIEKGGGGPLILIKKNSNIEEELDALIHECIHGEQFDFLAEEFVEMMATDVARAILKRYHVVPRLIDG